MAGCEFNRELEMDKYVENKAAYGERFARQYLKTNMTHYRAKEAGQAVPSWDVYLTEKGLTSADGEGLLELTEQPLTSHLSAQVSSDIKLRVPVEMETVRHANTLALSGADTIFMPEHISENGGIFVRFVTRYKRDSTDPNKYQGSQIDLGKNMLPEEARNIIQDMMGRARPVQSLQSNTHKDAYAFALHEKANIREGVVQNNDKTTHDIVVPPRAPGLHTEEVIDPSVLERTNNTTHKTDIVGDVVNEGVKIGRKVVTDTRATLIAAGLFALEALKKRKKTEENKSAMPMVDKIRSVFVHKKEQFYELRDRQLKEVLHHVDRHIRESGKRFLARVVVRWHEMIAAKSMFAFAAESGVGIGVALLGLKFMTRELPKKPRKKQLERKFYKTGGYKNAEVVIEPHEKKRVFKKFVLPTRVDKILLKHNFVKKEKRGAKPSRVIEMARRGFVFKKGEGRGAAKERAAQVAKPAERLWTMAVRLARRLERSKKRQSKESFQTISLREIPVENGTRHGQELALSFSFAWSLWALLFLSRNEHKQQDPHIFIYEKTRVSKQELTENDPQPWILFAIIWHLAMIREQGLRNYPINQLPNTTNNPIKKRKQRFALREGVIFAYTH